MKLLTITVLLILLGCVDGPSNATKDVDTFDWVLARLGESPRCAAIGSGVAERFRLLHVPPHGGRVVLVTLWTFERGDARARILDADMRLNPDRLEVVGEEVRSLDRRRGAEFQKLVDRAGFWTLPDGYPPLAEDADHVYLEGRRSTECHVVEWLGVEKVIQRELVAAFLALGESDHRF